MPLVTVHDVRAAAHRIRGLAVRTPLLPCPWADSPLLLKPESLQATGAFKIRGASCKLDSLGAAERACGVVAHSSGNHAQAVAFAARRFGIRAVIVMPDAAPAVKIEATRALGAEVVLVPAAEREECARELAEREGLRPVPPYDDPAVIAGQGTVGLEIAEDAAEVLGEEDVETGTVLVPVSGGGLISGVAVAVRALRPRMRVIGVEPELAADLREGFLRGERVTWGQELTARTAADGLRASPVGDLAWEHIRALVDDVVTVSEDEIREAMRVLAYRSRLVAEPSGAVATAAYLFRRDQLPGGTYVCVVSGGNVDPALLAEILGVGSRPWTPG
ncbi:MAG: threonine ammonia-lyase [Streptomycetales bacterium]